MAGTPPSSRPLQGLELDYVQFVADVAITAGTDATATTIVTANAVTFDGATIVLIEFFSQKVTTGALLGEQLVLNLYQDGADIGRIAQVQTAAAVSSGAAVHAIRRMTPAAGARTYSIRGWNTAASNGNVQAGAGGAGTSMPGFIRITRAV